MPEVKEEVPEKLRPYIFHGVDLTYGNGKEALGECPWCGSSRKFTVLVETGQWRCLSCNEGKEVAGSTFRGGNAVTFLRMLQERSIQSTKANDYEDLATIRRLGKFETLIAWDVCKSYLTGDWLVPGYGLERQLAQLYRYTRYEGRMKLLLTPTLGHKLHGLNLYDKNKGIVNLAEGPWDAMAIWEGLGITKEVDGGLAETANQSASLLADVNVLAVPGCAVFFDSWTPWFYGKVVNFMYDNDHSRVHPKTGKPVEPPALQHMKRVSRVMAACPTPPEQMNFLKWGDAGYETDLPNGYDVTDALSKEPV